jgi:hypothetical protein
MTWMTWSEKCSESLLVPLQCGIVAYWNVVEGGGGGGGGGMGQRVVKLRVGAVQIDAQWDIRPLIKRSRYRTW